MLALQLAMKLAPDRKKFMEVIASSGDVMADIDKFCTSFSPLLDENHKFLVRYIVSIYFKIWAWSQCDSSFMTHSTELRISSLSYYGSCQGGIWFSIPELYGPVGIG